jgi:thiol-disulfide isomerase/thioredoxin
MKNQPKIASNVLQDKEDWQKIGTGTQAIDRATTILRKVVSEQRNGISLADMVMHLNVSRPTVYRIASCLERQGFLYRDIESKQYFLGDFFANLSVGTSPHASLRKICSETIRQLAIDAGFVLVANNPALLLQLEDEQGNKSKLSDYKDKTVMLHFWGVQCPHCLKEMQSLLELEKSFQGKSFVVLHVCTDEDDAKVAQQIASKYAPGIKIVVETSGIGMARYEVQTLPAFWLIGGGGCTLARSTGAKDWASSSCKNFIESLIPN